MREVRPRLPGDPAVEKRKQNTMTEDMLFMNAIVYGICPCPCHCVLFLQTEPFASAMPGLMMSR